MIWPILRLACEVQMLSNQLNSNLFKSSSVGTTVDSSEEILKVDYEYTFIGWFFITFFGTTRMPRKIKFICKKSGEVFDEVTDQERIEHYMLFRRK